MGHLTSAFLNVISAFLNGNFTYWILPTLFVLTPIVLFHELGHYVVARLCGIRVTVFSLGFGRELAGFDDRHGTRWKISMIPLGGYVKFFGDENEASVPNQAALAAMTAAERRKSFPGQPVGNRAAVAAAGPIVNFILAIVIFAGVALAYGEPTGTNAPRIGSVEPGSPAAAAGIRHGDLVLSIDGAKVETFEDIKQIVESKPGVALAIVVDRDGAQTTLQATPAEHDHHGKLGISSWVVMKSVAPVRAVQLGAESTWNVIALTMTTIHDIALGKQSAGVVGGPIMIADLAGKVAQLGFDKLLWLTAVLSVSVGLFNLFPIPILDGGHLLFCLIEAVQGRPLSERAQEVSFRIGLATIMTLMVLVIGHDVITKFTGSRVPPPAAGQP
jgi:regulator of sigma E protease